MISIREIEAAAKRLGTNVHRTPLVSSRRLSERAGGPVFLKCENLQRVGAFKIRGALNWMRANEAAAREHGVTTFSSGNHGQALALAARIVGARAVVFVPETVAGVKAAAIEAYGAEVRRAGTTSEHRKKAAQEGAARHGWKIVPPFDDPFIVAGQGTVGLEITDQLAERGVRPDVVLVPTGGGGLLAGTSLAVTTRVPSARVFAVEPESAAKMGRALAAGAPVTIDAPNTIADGLQPLRAGDLPFAIAKERAAGAITVTDEEIRTAMRFLAEAAKLVVEPSGAVGVAALLAGKLALDGQTAVCVLSGGNVERSVLAEILRGA